jgi:1-acyl-sn-glycerol-3-phosphate acyltransferase
MTPEFWAKITIFAFAVIAVALVVRDIVRWKIGWQVWFLYFLNRTYGAFFFHPRFNRRCPFPENGPGLIISNHRSPVDPLVIWANHHLGSRSGRIRNFRFMMAREYLSVPGIGWITRSVKVIPADRDGRDFASARESLRVLKEGELLCLFPEGRLNRGTDLLEASTGIAWLALRAKVPVYPIYVHNTPQDGMVKAFCGLSRVNVSYGDPIDLSMFEGQKKTQELLRTVTDLMMQRIAVLGGVNITSPVIPNDSTTEETDTLEFQRPTG